MQTDIGAEHYVLITPVRVRVAVINAVYGAVKTMATIEYEGMWQVNRHNLVDGSTQYSITRYSDDGYVGTTTDTIYEDGCDTTDWCLFTGSHHQCEQWMRVQQVNDFIREHPERVEKFTIHVHAEAL